MSDILDRAVSVALICGTIVVAGAVIHRVNAPRPGGPATAETPEFRENWRRGLPMGRFATGDSASEVVLIEFVDLECPACQSYHPTVKDVVSKYPNAVGHLYIQFPLAFHPNAQAAAHAVECVALADANQVGPFVETALAHQHMLGAAPWDSLAASIGLPSGIDFVGCIGDVEIAARIAAGVEFAKQMGVEGTPTVMINGWIYRGLPRYRVLDSLVASLL